MMLACELDLKLALDLEVETVKVLADELGWVPLLD